MIPKIRGRGLGCSHTYLRLRARHHPHKSADFYVLIGGGWWWVYVKSLWKVSTPSFIIIRPPSHQYKYKENLLPPRQQQRRHIPLVLFWIFLHHSVFSLIPSGWCNSDCSETVHFPQSECPPERVSRGAAFAPAAAEA